MTNLESELINQIAYLLKAKPADITVEPCDNGELVGVLYDGDIIGSGECNSEALVEAMTQARTWAEAR